MARKSTRKTSSRRRRVDPDRVAPNRSGSEHILRNAGRGGDEQTSRSRHKPGLISDSVQQAISGMVELSSDVIEEQIRAGQQAANRLREGIASSQKLDTDIHSLVENLVATTRDVGATWLDLVSLVIRAIGTQPPDPGKPGGGKGGGQPQTVTETGTSGSAATVSSITPFDPAIAGIPPKIMVRSERIKQVTLDLRPPSARFVPVVRALLGSNAIADLVTATFALNRDAAILVLTIAVGKGAPAGTYHGVVLDSSSTAVSGGTLSVTVSD